MPVAVNDQTYYRTTEVCRIVGISRNTLFRWLREGKGTEVEYRDYRGWRLFTQAQVDAMKRKITEIRATHFGEGSRSERAGQEEYVTEPENQL